jgi:hypothetical protein
MCLNSLYHIIVVGTVTTLRVGRYGDLSIAGSSDFCLLNNRQALGPTQSIIQWIPGGGLLRLRRDVNNSSPSSAKVKNVWSCTHNPPMRLHDLYIDNFRILHLFCALHVNNSPIDNIIP